MEEVAYENGQFSDFQWLVILTLDQVILYTVMHHSSTSAYISNFIEIEKTFCERTNGRITQRNFVADVFQEKLNFTSKNSKIAILSHPLGLNGNVRGSSMAHWHVRSTSC